MLRGIVIACVVSLAGGAVARAQLVTNGNFNSPPGGSSTTWSSTLINPLTGWTLDLSPTGGVEYGTTFGTPGISSTQSLLLATTAAGSQFNQGGIQQTLTTVPGQVYDITIEAKADKNATAPTLTLDFGGTSNSQTATFGSLTQTWTGLTWAVTATSSSSILNLIGYKGNPITTNAVVVSDLSVTAVPTVWLGGTSSNWATAANWSSGTVPDAAGAAATFGTASSNGNVSIASGSETLGTLNFVNGAGYVSTTISGSSGNYLILDNTGVSPSAVINVSGAHSISANVQLNSPLGVTVTSGSDRLNISGVMANGTNGAQGLSLAGSGTLNLSGANTMSGSVSVNSGTLLLSNNAALQNATLAGGGPTFASGITAPAFGGLAGGGSFALATVASEPVALTVGGNGQSTIYSGVLSGAGSLTKAGGGMLTLGGANTFSGNTLISGGTLVIGNANALQNSALDTSGGGALSFGAQTSASLGGLTGGGGLNLINAGSQPVSLTVGGAGQNLTYSGAITDGGLGGSVTMNGAAMQVLSGHNNYSGGSNVTAGTLQFQGAGALPSGGSIGLGGGWISIANNGSGSGGTISPGSNITLTAAATVGIDVRNNGSGNTNNTVSFGTLSNGTPANNLTSTINFTAANGYQQSFAALNLPGNTGDPTTLNPTSTTVAIQGNVTNQITTASGGWDPLYLDGTTSGNVIYGQISDSPYFVLGAATTNGATWLYKSNASQWILAGTNSYSGPTLISGGTLQLGTGRPGQDGALYIGSKTTGGVTNNSVLAFNYFGSVTASYSISGVGSVSAIGPGSVILTASNNYTGATNVTAGTLALGYGGSIQQSSAINLRNGATFDVSQVSFDLVSGQTLSGTGNYTVNGAMTADSGSTILPGGVGSAGTLNVGGLTLSPGSALTYYFTPLASRDLINVTGAYGPLTVNGGAISLYSTNGSTFSTPGTYPIIAYSGALNGDPSNLSVSNPNVNDIYSFTAASTSGGNFVDLNILAGLAWTGSAGAPFHWSAGNNWASHAAIQTGQAAYFQGTTGLNNVNDIAGLNLAGIIFGSTAGTFSISGDDIQLSGPITNSSAGTQSIGLNIQLTGNQTVTAAGNVVLSGVISDGGNQFGLSTAGNGTVVLDGANTYSGTTNVTAGKLRLANSLAVQDSTLNIGGGGLLSFAAGITSPTIGGLAGNGGTLALATVTGQAVALNVVSNGQNTTYSGVLSGTGGSLIKQGPGTLSLAAQQTYGGATVVSGNGSVLQLGNLQSTTISGFGTNGAGWTLNSSNGTPATVVSNVLTLTFNTGFEARSAFRNQPVSVSAFNASFVYQETTGTSGVADGVALVWQNSSGGPSALGGTGGSLGYSGISPSAAVEINIYSTNTVGTNYATNGATGNYSATTPVNPASEDPIQVTLNYDGVSTLTETMSDMTTGQTYTTAYSIGNLTSTLGSGMAYLGFTGGDGGEESTQKISNFTYTYYPKVNILPTTTALSVANGATVDLNGVYQTVASLSSTDGLGSQVYLGSYGELTIAGTAATTFDGVISDGPTGQGGALNVQSGRLTLTGQNTYSGATTIGGGTLQLATGANGQDGSISGTSGVNDNGTLLYNFNDSQTVAYSIAGNGSLRKAGNGTLTLTATNTYTGATAINGGTLQLGTGQSGQDGSIAGTSGVLDNGGLVFDLAGSQTASYRISGSGSLSMIGDGMLTLSGSNTYSGGTFVEYGTLVATNNAAIAGGSSLTVGNPAYFGAVDPAAAASSSGAAPVPEPGTLALAAAAAGGAALVCRRSSAKKRRFCKQSP